MKSKNLLLLAAFALLIAPAGCIFSPDDDGGGGGGGGTTTDLPWPGSPDVLMDNFMTIYETMDYEEYRKILHPDFLTILQESTSEEFPLIGTTLDVNEELIIHQGMFSGDPLTNQRGDFVPGVSGISFSRFRALDTWVPSPENDIIPNAEWALFEVEFLFDRGQTFSTLKVAGKIKFYVTSKDSVHQGSSKKYYQMKGQVDLTNLD